MKEIHNALTLKDNFVIKYPFSVNKLSKKMIHNLADISNEHINDNAILTKISKKFIRFSY